MSFYLDASERFKKATKKLPRDIKVKLEKTLDHLSKNTRHPSLKTHKVKDAKGFFSSDVFEAYVDSKYRLTWEYRGKGAIYLRNVDNHDQCLKNP